MSSQPARRLIEYDLPLADIFEESAREKNIRYGHPSTLHIWRVSDAVPSLSTEKIVVVQ